MHRRQQLQRVQHLYRQRVQIAAELARKRYRNLSFRGQLSPARLTLLREDLDQQRHHYKHQQPAQKHQQLPQHLEQLAQELQQPPQKLQLAPKRELLPAFFQHEGHPHLIYKPEPPQSDLDPHNLHEQPEQSTGNAGN